MQETISLTLDPPFLIATFAQPHRVLSWSMLRPGIAVVRRVAWLEVRNDDLPAHIDAEEFVRARIAQARLDDAVVLVTSRDIRRFRRELACVEGEAATCITTVGLSNSERVGERLHRPPVFAGTINTLVHVERPLSDGALIEAMSIATEARTAAVMDGGVRRGGLAITGTGTDCIAVASPVDEAEIRYAGKHTAVGEAIGAAVYRATAAGIGDWMVDCGYAGEEADRTSA